MKMKIIALCGFLCVGTAGALWASQKGMGLPQPDKSPPSLREESARGKSVGTGHRRTRFFMGGGLQRGKYASRIHVWENTGIGLASNGAYAHSPPQHYRHSRP